MHPSEDLTLIEEHLRHGTGDQATLVPLGVHAGQVKLASSSLRIAPPWFLELEVVSMLVRLLQRQLHGNLLPIFNCREPSTCHDRLRLPRQAGVEDVSVVIGATGIRVVQLRKPQPREARAGNLLAHDREVVQISTMVQVARNLGDELKRKMEQVGLSRLVCGSWLTHAHVAETAWGRSSHVVEPSEEEERVVEGADVAEASEGSDSWRGRAGSMERR